MEGKKKFSLTSAILSVICVVFVAEAAAPVAAIGNSQFFWWIFLLIAFLLPYGLISSELGTTYIGEGGIYDWVTKAYGHRWGARVSWYYWINYPLWLASLAVMTPELLTTITGIKFSTPMMIISVIIFNLLGFEVICTFADDMENPKKQIPQAIVAAGLVIAAIYIFSAFGIGVAIPTDQISTGSGMMDSFKLLTGSTEGWFIMLMAFLFLLTLFGNMISWSLGVNNTACYAAENGDMPKFFEKRSKKNDMPIGAALMNGIVASVVIVLAPILPNQDLFWAFFSLNVVLFLLSYIPVFPAFYKLRKIDPDTPRPFKVNGKPGFLKVLVVLPMIMIIISLIFTAVPLDFSPAALNEKLPITIGAIIFILFGEVIIYVKKIKKGTKENG
ncbi:MAG: APC family permease [Enterococcus faecalis]|nr:APC family permease [Enterococcus faecalis]